MSAKPDQLLGQRNYSKFAFVAFLYFRTQKAAENIEILPLKTEKGHPGYSRSVECFRWFHETSVRPSETTSRVFITCFTLIGF